MSSEGNGLSIVAVDTGGTFTDVVCWANGRIVVAKVPSTPDDPALAVLDGIARVIETGTPFVLVHGSTVATNALLERRGARVALITNAGFEDVIEIGRQNRPQLYALTGHRAPPLVARDDRHGVHGRLGPDGAEIEPLDVAELDGLRARIGDAESIAICMLHSYADDGHERRVADALAGIGLPVSVSSELLPEFREYERTATTVVNAYVTPMMRRYLGRLAESNASHIRIMGSGGGAIPLARAAREAVHTVLSGPAGGVAGAMAAARASGFDHVLTFDMGGTSTDVSLCPGRPLQTREFSIAGLPVAVPVLDIHTVGAGGGSIARVDAGGALRVGPESAGADPGPICYGRGGTAVTVTDANVWLGRLPASSWRHRIGSEDAGGALDRAAIAGPLNELAARMGADADAAAEGVIAVANAAMEGALRVISVERGYDPADFTLVCFGGAAGLHAVDLAEKLDVSRVLVPPGPGVLSAWGMLVAPVRKDASRTVLRAGTAAGDVALEADFAALEDGALAAMREEGVERDQVAIRRRIDARYHGQSFELTVEADGWVDAFHAAHEQRYGYATRGAPVEAVTLRVEALAPAAMQEQHVPVESGTGAGAATTPVTAGGRRTAARLCARADLSAGTRVSGPAVVTEYSSTLWIPPGWSGLVDASLAIVVSRD